MNSKAGLTSSPRYMAPHSLAYMGSKIMLRQIVCGSVVCVRIVTLPLVA